MSTPARAKHKVKHVPGKAKNQDEDGYYSSPNFFFSEDVRDWCNGKSKAARNAKALF